MTYRRAFRGLVLLLAVVGGSALVTTQQGPRGEGA